MQWTENGRNGRVGSNVQSPVDNNDDDDDDDDDDDLAGARFSQLWRGNSAKISCLLRRVKRRSHV